MNRQKILITTGDVDGIGLEVTIKALVEIGSQKNIQFLVFRSQKTSDHLLTPLYQAFKYKKVSSLKEALSETTPLVDISSPLSPAHWVEEAALCCLRGDASALTTAPLSKTTIKNAGFKDLGHTDILKRISKSKNVNMGFIGPMFNVVIATAHIPLQEVSKALDLKTLKNTLINTQQLVKNIHGRKKPKPIGILGLNPHAGEQGLIGQEELNLFPKLKRFALNNEIEIIGPLVPDAAFFKSQWPKYSAYIALYHDQGLIPFKMIHGQDSGVHITLGIPFIRTSVDHGTAKDIYGKDMANPSSMRDSVNLAIKLSRLS